VVVCGLTRGCCAGCGCGCGWVGCCSTDFRDAIIDGADFSDALLDKPQQQVGGQTHRHTHTHTHACSARTEPPLPLRQCEASEPFRRGEGKGATSDARTHDREEFEESRLD